MTNMNTALRDRVLDRDDDLRDVLEVLLERADRRQLWLMFMDGRGCLGEPLMPMADLPDDPDEITETDDLGEVTHAVLLAQRAGMLREVTGNEAMVLAWERLGSSAIADEDRTWARAMADAAAQYAVPLRAQFIVHDRGVRQLHPDDYL